MGDRTEVEWEPEQIARFWDYQSHRPSVDDNYFSVGYGRWIVKRTLKWFPQSRAARVLDLGCGPGHLMRHLAHSGKTDLQVSGADFSSESVAKALANCADLIPVPCVAVVDGYPTPFEDGSFDVVYSVEVVEHLDDATLKAMLDDVFRVLSAGGIVVITTPNDENLEALHTCCPNCSSTFHIWQHVRSWDAESLRAALSGRGFEVVGISATRFESPLIRFAFWLAERMGKSRKQPPHLLGVFRKPA